MYVADDILPVTTNGY